MRKIDDFLEDSEKLFFQGLCAALSPLIQPCLEISSENERLQQSLLYLLKDVPEISIHVDSTIKVRTHTKGS